MTMINSAILQHKTRPILLLILPILLFGCASPEMKQRQKPNLVIIHTDEHSFRTLGCYRELLSIDQAFVWGEGLNVETTHIDWLAQNGVLFSKCYASTPVCSPSRASFLTGLYPHHTGVTKNDVPMLDEMITFAQILQDKGYHTGYLGKWHLDGTGKPQWEPERKFGFMDNRYMYNRGHWKKMEDTPEGPRVASVNGDGTPNYYLDGADEKSFTTDFLTDRTIRLISENKDGPFCFMVSIPDPHGPDRVRPPYDAMYQGLPFTPPPTYHKQVDGVPSWARPQETAQTDQSQYFGMVKCIDDNVGKLIDFLRSEGLLDHTIMVFTSDHGDLRAEHHRHNKGVPLEASAKIPLIIYYPQKITGGTVVANAVSTVDFAPTILGLMQIDHQAAMQGTDLSEMIMHPTGQTNGKDIAFIRSTGTGSNGNWMAAFTSRYKLILSKNDDPWLLDLEQDPDELINFIDEPGNAQVVRTLAAALQEYALEFGDPYLKDTKMSDDLMGLLDHQ